MSTFHCALLFTLATVVSTTVLVGVTIESSPFLYTDNNQFSGYCVDLLEQIKIRTGLNYSLYLVENNHYGPRKGINGQITGLIGDVFHKKADFAIADITVTEARKKYVAFTDPIYTFSISALVRADKAKYLETIDDLAMKSNLSVGAFRTGNTIINIRRLTTLRNIRWLYKRMKPEEENLVGSLHEAMRNVHSSSYAFMQEEPKNQFLANQNCSLKVLTDPNSYVEGVYAIAFAKDSPYLEVFNQALRDMRKKGVLRRLRDLYFKDKCGRSSAHSSTHHYPILLMMLLLSVTFSISL